MTLPSFDRPPSDLPSAPVLPAPPPIPVAPVLPAAPRIDAASAERPVMSGVNGFAVASLVLGVVGFLGVGTILAIVFGIVALVQLRSRVQAGKGLAITGLALGGLWIGVLVVALILSATAAPAPQTAPDSSREYVQTSRLSVGTCVEDIAEGRMVASLPAVPCSWSHEAEVFARYELPDVAYPGNAEVDQLAGDGCTERVDGYATDAAVDPDLTVLYVAPPEQTWSRNRIVVCLLSHSPRRGSIRD